MANASGQRVAVRAVRTMCIVVSHATSLIVHVGLCTHRNQKLTHSLTHSLSLSSSHTTTHTNVLPLRTPTALRPSDSLLHHPEPRWEDADGKMVRSTSCACVCACVQCTLLHCKLVLSGWCVGVQKNAGLKWCDANDLTRAHEHLVSTCCISAHCAGLFGHELPR